MAISLERDAAARPGSPLDSVHTIVTMAPDLEAVDAAFSAFFHAQFTKVTRVVYIIVRDSGAAEDIAQEAFTELLRRWDKISGYERPDAWVRRIAIRRAARFVRRQRLQDLLMLRFQPPTPGRETIDPDLDAAIRCLPAKQRAAIVLHYFEDRPLTEVAQILGCSHSTAKVHVHKARQRLAAALDPESAGTG